MMAAHQRRGRRASTRRGQRPSILSTIVLVMGELLVTVGVVVLLFVAWQVWIYDPSVARAQTSIADQYVNQWSGESLPAPSESVPPTVVSADAAPVAARPEKEGTVWGVLYVPRFGNDWRKAVAWGTDMSSVLNRIGIGTYTQSTMPGAVGNTAVASHRSGMGSSFYNIHKLRLGDKVVLETQEGWYTYAYRNTEYIVDADVQVLNPVPMVPGATATGKVLTLQSCNPLPVSNQERIMAFTVLESFTPRSSGAPAIVAQMGGN